MILLYNTNATRNPNAYLTLAVEAALRSLVGAEGVRRVDERTLAREAASRVHALLLCIDGQRLNAGLIARVKPAFRRVVLWAFEDPFMLDYNLAHASLFDLVFTNDPSCVAAYGARGHYLPLAGSRMLHHRDVLPDPKLRHDIFFAGTMWPNRVAVLRRVIAAFPDASMKLVCPTNEYLPPLPPQIASRAITRPISHEAFVGFANASRVTLTLFRDYASHGASALAHAPGPRLFELGLAGTAQVVQRPDGLPAAPFAAIDGILLDHGEALVTRIGDVLADTELRTSLARLAQRSVLASHGYEHRLRRLLELSLADDASDAPPATMRSTVPERRLRVLMCTHSTIRNQVWGGVEVYQQMLCDQLEQEAEVLFWIRGEEGCELLDSRGATLERFDGAPIGWLDVLCDPFEETHFSDVLTSYDVDVVHFQHLGHHAASLPLIARAAGVGTLLSVHDFFLVCARYNLLDHEQKFCDIGARSISACTICLARAEGLPAGVQQQRRGFMEQVLGAVDLLLFGSRQSEALVLRIYPQTRSIRRLVMGVPAPAPPLPHAAIATRHDRRTDPDVLDVVVMGNFLRIKGADTVLQVIEAAPPHLFRFHILGAAEPHYHEVLRALGPRVTYHGRYAPGDAALSHGQVALHLSIWPETYCISLSEVWQAGLIPIVTDIGALGERVSHGVDGFKVRVGDAGAVLDLLEVLRANPGLRETLRRGIGPHLWADADAYAARILGEYRALAPRVRLGTGGPLGLDVDQLHLLATRRWKEIAPPRNILEHQPGAGLMLDLPPSIVEWASIQRCRAYVDAICGEETDPLARDDDDEPATAAFRPVDRFSMTGWVFQPGASQAGQAFVCLIHRSGRHVVFLEAGRQPRADVQAIHPEAPLRSGYAAEVRLAGKWPDGAYGIGVIVVPSGRAAFQLCRHQLWFLDGRVVRLAAAATDPASVLRAFACVFSCSPLAERFIAARSEACREPPTDTDGRELAAPEAGRGSGPDRVENRRAEGSGGRPLQE